MQSLNCEFRIPPDALARLNNSVSKASYTYPGVTKGGMHLGIASESALAGCSLILEDCGQYNPQTATGN